MKGERNVLIIGLEKENIDGLLNDRPIRKDFSKDVPEGSGLEDWDVLILGPEDPCTFCSPFWNNTRDLIYADVPGENTPPVEDAQSGASSGEGSERAGQR
jgi:hypothetical protein